MAESGRVLGASLAEGSLGPDRCANLVEPHLAQCWEEVMRQHASFCRLLGWACCWQRCRPSELRRERGGWWGWNTHFESKSLTGSPPSWGIERTMTAHSR